MGVGRIPPSIHVIEGVLLLGLFSSTERGRTKRAVVRRKAPEKGCHMRSIVRSAVSLGGLMVPAAAVTLLTATADAESASCKAFRQSMASYQRELKAAIRDEPEDLG